MAVSSGFSPVYTVVFKFAEFDLYCIYEQILSLSFKLKCLNSVLEHIITTEQCASCMKIAINLWCRWDLLALQD